MWMSCSRLSWFINFWQCTAIIHDKLHLLCVGGSKIESYWHVSAGKLSDFSHWDLMIWTVFIPFGCFPHGGLSFLCWSVFLRIGKSTRQHVEYSPPGCLTRYLHEQSDWSSLCCYNKLTGDTSHRNYCLQNKVLFHEKEEKKKISLKFLKIKVPMKLPHIPLLTIKQNIWIITLH